MRQRQSRRTSLVQPQYSCWRWSPTSYLQELYYMQYYLLGTKYQEGMAEVAQQGLRSYSLQGI